ncbi:MAG: hypothetical protein RLZ28_687, partial [Actinomycetota bacterium]
MFRKKGFRALASLLSLAMLTVGLATSMTQAAQAAELSMVQPSVAATSASTAFNTPVSLKPTVVSYGTDLSFCLVAPALSTADATEADCSNGPVKVAGQGAWNIASKTGEVLFTPEANFAGTTTPVSYLATDSAGTGKAPLKVDVEKPIGPIAPTSTVQKPIVVKTPTLSTTPVAPVVTPVDAKSPFGKTFSFKPRVTGAGVDFSNTCLIDPADGSCTDKVVVAGEGTWRVKADGWASFTPKGDFTGTTSPVKYQIKNKAGLAGEASAKVTVMAPAAPFVRTLFEITDYNSSVTLSPVVTGEALDVSQTCLIDPADGLCKSSITVDEGTWTVNEADGSVTFTPAATYAGTTKSVEYRAYNTIGDFGKAGIMVHVNRPTTPPIVANGAGDVTTA